MRTGKTYVLGRHVDGGFAVWDQTISRPVERYAAADYSQANREMDFAENMPIPPQGAVAVAAQGGHGGLITLLVLVLVFAGIYLWVHAHRYSGCVLAPPGIFEWPSACL